MTRRNSVAKYLSKYAEAESQAAYAVAVSHFCLVIPAFNESWIDIQRVWQDLAEDFLVILVVNSPDERNSDSLNLINDIKLEAVQSELWEPAMYLTLQSGQRLIVIDRTTEPIPRKQGVGLARKIGADLALSLIHAQKIRFPVIFNTDADAVLPDSYFASVKNNYHAERAVFLYPFLHRAEPGLEEACYSYEISLSYYVAGLRYAGSKYGYHTIGSTLAINAQHYAMVRGFPRINAAEDFYLLNKLAKVGDVFCLSSSVIALSGRLSDRVVFGTGTGIRKRLNTTIHTPSFYHPLVFESLRVFLKLLYTCQHVAHLIDYFRHSKNEQIQMGRIQQWCESQKLFALIEKKQPLAPAVFRKFLDDWLDGFKTLKFIHFMREIYPDIPLTELHEAPFLPDLTGSDVYELSQARLKIQLQNAKTSL